MSGITPVPAPKVNIGMPTIELAKVNEVQWHQRKAKHIRALINL